jgi:hypothetical protein
MKNNTTTWFAILTAGSSPRPAQGPFRSIEDAREAVQRFRESKGSLAGTYLASGSALIAGPYPTRAKAKAADIGDRKVPVVEGVR